MVNEEKVKALKLSASKIGTKTISTDMAKNHYFIMIEKTVSTTNYHIGFWIETGSTVTSATTREDLYNIMIDKTNTHITGGTGSITSNGVKNNICAIYAKYDDDVCFQVDGSNILYSYAYIIYELNVTVKVIATDKAGSFMNLLNE